MNAPCYYCFSLFPFCGGLFPPRFIHQKRYDAASVPPCYVAAVKWQLLRAKLFRGVCGKWAVSPQLLRELMIVEEDLDPDDEFGMEEDHDCDDFEDEDGWIIRGVPRRPLFRELAHRLYKWEHCRNDCTLDQLLVPAHELGFEEEVPPPPLAFPSDMNHWLSAFGDRGVLALLGQRCTVGTDRENNWLPPSRRQLLDAARQPHKKPGRSQLTAAARARAKHAHRGAERFFGVVQGSPDEQNRATMTILNNLLAQAVWINIHTFSGMENPVLEIRVRSGYGARWTADWSQHGGRPTNVTFRGFLEPQMSDGHEKGWRH